MREETNFGTAEICASFPGVRANGQHRDFLCGACTVSPTCIRPAGARRPTFPSTSLGKFTAKAQAIGPPYLTAQKFDFRGAVRRSSKHLPWTCLQCGPFPSPGDASKGPLRECRTLYYTQSQALRCILGRSDLWAAPHQRNGSRHCKVANLTEYKNPKTFGQNGDNILPNWRRNRYSTD